MKIDHFINLREGYPILNLTDGKLDEKNNCEFQNNSTINICTSFTHF